MSHEFLVAELLAHTSQESFQVFELSLCLLYFGSHINLVAKRNGIFCGAHHEGGSGAILFGHDVDGTEVGHLGDDTAVGLQGVVAHHLQGQCLAWRDVFLVAHGAHTAHYLFQHFDVGGHAHIIGCRGFKMQTVAHDRLARLAVVNVLPQFFGDEWHEGVKHLEQHLEEVQCGVVGGTVDGLLIVRLHHLQVPA